MGAVERHFSESTASRGVSDCVSYPAFTFRYVEIIRGMRDLRAARRLWSLGLVAALWVSAVVFRRGDSCAGVH